MYQENNILLLNWSALLAKACRFKERQKKPYLQTLQCLGRISALQNKITLAQCYSFFFFESTYDRDFDCTRIFSELSTLFDVQILDLATFPTTHKVELRGGLYLKLRFCNRCGTVLPQYIRLWTGIEVFLVVFIYEWHCCTSAALLLAANSKKKLCRARTGLVQGADHENCTHFAWCHGLLWIYRSCSKFTTSFLSVWNHAFWVSWRCWP